MALASGCDVNSSRREGGEEGGEKGQEGEACGEKGRGTGQLRGGAGVATAVQEGQEGEGQGSRGGKELIECGGWEMKWEYLVGARGREWAGKLFISWRKIETLKKFEKCVIFRFSSPESLESLGGSVEPCQRVGSVLEEGCEEAMWGRGYKKEIRWACGAG